MALSGFIEYFTNQLTLSMCTGWCPLVHALSGTNIRAAHFSLYFFPYLSKLPVNSVY